MSETEQGSAVTIARSRAGTFAHIDLHERGWPARFGAAERLRKKPLPNPSPERRGAKTCLFLPSPRRGGAGGGVFFTRSEVPERWAWEIPPLSHLRRVIMNRREALQTGVGSLASPLLAGNSRA